MSDVILDEKAREAVHAARNAAHAVEVARQVQLEHASRDAATAAAKLASENIEQKIIDEDRMSEIMVASVKQVLEMGTESKRSLVIARIPYICADITSIKESLKKLEGAQVYSPLVQKIVFGLVSLILVSVAAAMIALVVTQHI